MPLEKKALSLSPHGLLLAGRVLSLETEVLVLQHFSARDLCGLSTVSHGVRAAAAASLSRRDDLCLSSDPPASVLAHCRRLRTLTIQQPVEHRTAMALVAANAATLTSLDYFPDLPDTDNSTADFLSSTLLKCGRLRHLNAPSLHLTTDATRKLVRSCPHLAEIDVFELDEAVLLSARLPLRRFEDSARISPAEYALLPGHSSLETLRLLYHLEVLGRTGLLRLLRGLSQLPRLQQLEIAFTDHAITRAGEEEGEEGEEEAARFCFPELRMVRLRYYGSERPFFEVSGPQVDKLKLEGDVRPSLAQLMSAFPALTKLSHHFKQAISAQDAEASAAVAQERKAWPALQRLSLYRMSRAYLVRLVLPLYHATLRKVSLGMGYRVVVPHARALLSQLQSLEFLRISVTDGIPGYSEESVAAQAALCDLQSQVLAVEARPASHEEKATQALFSRQQQRHALVVNATLRQLSLCAGDDVESGMDEGKAWPLPSLFDSLWLPGLRELWLRQQRSSHPVNITSIVTRSCPALAVLRVSGCAQATLPSPYPPFRLPAVAAVHCSQCPGISPQDVQRFRGG